MRLLKFLFGLALIPLCASTTLTLIALARRVGFDGTSRTPLLAFGGGFLLWLVLFLIAPRPMRAYVFAHELTHALWGWAMGAKVGKLRVSEKGGSVLLSKSNVWITLAPYFFPLYAVLAVIAYFVVAHFWNQQAYVPFWMALVGLAWSFHITFTVSSLYVHQSDLEEHGYVFSLGIIYLLNLLTVTAGVVAVASPGWRDWMHQGWTDLKAMGLLLGHGAELLRGWITHLRHR